MSRRLHFVSIVTALALAVAAPATTGPRAELPAGCTDLPWDFSRELALFAGQGAELRGAARVTDAPSVATGSLYALALLPQDTVAFARPPGRDRGGEGGRAALVALTVPAAGRYRVTLDDGAWVDVLANGVPIASDRFQGRLPCPRFHKSVEFTLPAGERLLIQLSGARRDTVRLAVTPAP